MQPEASAPPLHVPVLLQEVLDNLPVPAGGRVLDLTLGLGGHAEAILARCDPGTRYLGVDRDPRARERARARLGSDARLTIIAGTYEDVWEDPGFEAWMHLQAPDGLDAILMDLGVSSLQLKDPGRGFSFQQEGPLDMRMDPESGITALDWLAEQTDASLADTLYGFGEERASRPVARAILKSLHGGTLRTTLDLAAAVYTVLPREVARRKKQIDPATRTFQAIRIAVNGELSRLARAMEAAVASLKPGGRLGIISFHSLEDRIAKQTLRRLAGIYDGPGRTAPQPLPRILRLIHAGGLKPGDAEAQANPPSRSARLRIGERLAEPLAEPHSSRTQV
jgi:16S rRNA (cytosine1402-N4)-methyltransferase